MSDFFEENKTLVIVLAVIVAAVGGYLYLSNQGNSDESASELAVDVDNDSNEEVLGSNDAMESNETMTEEGGEESFGFSTPQITNDGEYYSLLYGISYSDTFAATNSEDLDLVIKTGSCVTSATDQALLLNSTYDNDTRALGFKLKSNVTLKVNSDLTDGQELERVTYNVLDGSEVIEDGTMQMLVCNDQVVE